MKMLGLTLAAGLMLAVTGSESQAQVTIGNPYSGQGVTIGRGGVSMNNGYGYNNAYNNYVGGGYGAYGVPTTGYYSSGYATPGVMAPNAFRNGYTYPSYGATTYRYPGNYGYRAYTTPGNYNRGGRMFGRRWGR